MRSQQLKIAWQRLLDFLFPPPPELQKLKEMTVEELRRLQLAPEDPAIGNGSIAILDYRNLMVKAGIWALKFRGDRKVAALFAEILWETLLAEEEDKSPFRGGEKPVLTITPLSKKRIQERGFNQCELLVRCFPSSEAVDSFFEIRENLLRKIRETAPQTKIGRVERLKNLHGVFEVTNEAAVRNRRVIVIDDVTTTGATFVEARRALLSSGAREVICVALAH